MFFVRGLSSYGKDVFVNPDQVLYVCQVGRLRKKTTLILTHHSRLVVDQDPDEIRNAFRTFVRERLPADCSVEFLSHSGTPAIQLPSE